MKENKPSIQIGQVEKFPDLETNDINVLFTLIPLTAKAYKSCIIELNSVIKQVKSQEIHE